MRQYRIFLPAVLAALAAGRPVARAQSPAAAPGDIVPVSANAPAAVDLAKLPPLTRQAQLGARRGAEWLHRVNLPSGRFVHGWLPDLNVPLEGDHYLRQAHAAFALARAARFTGDERYTSRARQAVLSLLAETAAEPADKPNVRYTRPPSMVANRLASAGLLLLAIHELPSPAADLLDQGEQLANFIRQQQKADGSLRLDDQPADDPDAAVHPGVALRGLVASNRARPAAWKVEAARKALAFYRSAWKADPSPAAAAELAMAFAEAFVQTKE